MSIGGYKIRNKESIHFVTFAVVEWVDVFTRREYRDILLDSIRYCQKEKGLLLHSWCIMSNHVHFIISAADSSTNSISDILRDFKKFTAKQVIKAIQEHPGESRKQWMLDVFTAAGTANSRNKAYQFWRQENHPVELYTEAFAQQKLAYIHNNPVAAGIVGKAEAYLYSSAMDYDTGKK